MFPTFKLERTSLFGAFLICFKTRLLHLEITVEYTPEHVYIQFRLSS